jgi:large subunit ribosomal protein L4
MALQIPALNLENNSIAKGIEASEAIFGQHFNETLIHQLVTRHLAGARAGTKAQKTRSDVSGGGAKPWRQKGTGRARSGTTRSPVWRTGGVAFAARPRNYEQKLNRKMFRSGLCSILSELLRQDRIVVLENLGLQSTKTKELNAKLQTFNSRRVLLIVDQVDVNLALASRNLINVEVCEASNLNPVLLVAADKVIITVLALKQLEERLS